MRITTHILLGWLLLVMPAAAWNGLGHRTVATLAWRQMNDAQRRAATELLKHHPHYKVILTVNVPDGVDQGEWAYLTAAVWPDLIKPAKAGQPAKPHSITRYNVYPHGINLPFVHSADAGRVSLADFVVPEPNAATGLSNSIVTLKDTTATPHDRAVSLAWVLHLMGDLHQPLHAATLVTPKQPKSTASAAPAPCAMNAVNPSICTPIGIACPGPMPATPTSWLSRIQWLTHRNWRPAACQSTVSTRPRRRGRGRASIMRCNSLMPRTT